jgi:hypothetical protein
MYVDVLAGNDMKCAGKEGSAYRRACKFTHSKVGLDEVARTTGRPDIQFDFIEHIDG